MNGPTSSRSAEPSVATLLSFLSCATGAISFFMLTAADGMSWFGSTSGQGMPLPILIFVLSPWLLAAGVTLVARSPAWQRAWLACISVLAMANLAAVAVSLWSEDLLLQLLTAGGLPLFNICGVIVAGGLSWLIGITLDDSFTSHSGSRQAAFQGETSSHQTTSRMRQASAESLDGQTANSESRPDPDHSAP